MRKWGRLMFKPTPSLIRTVIHFPSASSILAEVNKSCSRSPAYLPTAPWQTSSSPSLLNPTAPVHRGEGWPVPRTRQCSHILLNKCRKGPAGGADTQFRWCMDSDPTYQVTTPTGKKHQLCSTLNARDYFLISRVKHAILDSSKVLSPFGYD